MDYIPSQETNLGMFVDNFRDLIAANPTDYGLVSGDATIITNAVDPWDAAYALATNPTTRTPATIAAKDDVKTAMLPTVRQYAQTIANNPVIDAALKVGLGLNPRTDDATDVPVPSTYPVLSIDENNPLQHVLRYRDQTAPETSRAKPVGAQFLELRVSVSATPIVDQNDLEFNQLATKVPVRVDYDAADVGKQAYFAARWINTTGKPGPWSAIGSNTVSNAA